MRRFLLTTAPGLEQVALDELAALQVKAQATDPGTLEARARLTDMLRLHLYARTLHRISMEIGHFRAQNPHALRQQAAALPWGTWLPKGAPFVVQASARRSRLYHTGAIEERVADAITQATGALHAPQDEGAQRVIARLDDDLCTLRLDMSGERLHQRGWRQAVGRAPLRESIAAGLLRWCGWTPQEALLDPMCGSGTLAIEAATIALGLAPGAQRPFALERWPCLDRALWGTLREAARARAPLVEAPRLFASDRAASALEAARANAARAGVQDRILWAERAVDALELPEGPGWLVCNPPYGERIGRNTDLRPLYRALGERVQGRAGWGVALLTSRPDLREVFERAARLQPEASLVITHGGLKVTATRYRVTERT